MTKSQFQILYILEIFSPEKYSEITNSARKRLDFGLPRWTYTRVCMVTGLDRFVLDK